MAEAPPAASGFHAFLDARLRELRRSILEELSRPLQREDGALAVGAFEPWPAGFQAAVEEPTLPLELLRRADTTATVATEDGEQDKSRGAKGRARIAEPSAAEDSSGSNDVEVQSKTSERLEVQAAAAPARRSFMPRFSSGSQASAASGDRKRSFWARHTTFTTSTGSNVDSVSSGSRLWRALSNVADAMNAQDEAEQSDTLKFRNSSLRFVVETVRNTDRKGMKASDRLMTHESWVEFRSAVAEWIMSIIIVLNTVVIALSSDLAKDWQGWLIIDAFFAAAFFLEMVVKFCTMGIAGYFCGTKRRGADGLENERRWRWFEFMLVVLSVVELAFTWAKIKSVGPRLTIFRMLRLARIARIFRVFRLGVFSELIMMINGALGGLKTLMWSLVLISLPLFTISWVLREMLGDANTGPGAENFSDTPTAFFTMFRCVIGSECTDRQGQPIFIHISRRYGWWYAALYCITLTLMTFGLFNVIAALFVENTLAAAKFNTVYQKRQRLLDAEMFAEKAVELVQLIFRVALQEGMSMLPEGIEADQVLQGQHMDDLMSMEITPEFFRCLQEYHEFHDILEDLDVSDEDKIDLFGTLDVDGSGTIDLEELVTGIAKLRGDARRSDIVGVALMTRSIQASLSALEIKVMDKIEAQRQYLLSVTQIMAMKGYPTDVECVAPSKSMGPGISMSTKLTAALRRLDSSPTKPRRAQREAAQAAAEAEEEPQAAFRLEPAAGLALMEGADSVAKGSGVVDM